MQQTKAKQWIRIKWGVAALILIASVMTVAGTASQARGQNGSGQLVPTAAGPEAASEVGINNYAFSPVPLTVKVGTTVTWINHDDDAHTVDSAQGKFKSGVLSKDDKFEYHFTEAGEYPIVCRFHAKMTGKIIVQP